MVGIDFRPATPGVLVALTLQETGANAGRGRIYEINPFTGVATLINPMLTNALGGAEVLLSSLNAFDYGIDFNPVPNALRIVNNADQNLRVVGGGAGVTNVDTNLNPGGQFVDAIAYSNNFAGATVTTLYGMAIIPEPDNLVTIGGLNGVPSPNGGMLLTVGQILPSNPSFLGDNGFDISGITGIAYALFQPSLTAPDTLFTLNLVTGQSTSLGAIVTPAMLRDISVFNGLAVPEPGSLALFGLSLAGLALIRRRVSHCS